MELRHLTYFMMVARQKSFTRAAHLLHIAQPSLSQQIQQFEQELGVTLITRTTRSVHLTAAGEALLRHAERITAAVEQAQQEMHEYAGASRGSIVIGTLTSLSVLQLPTLLRQFRERSPGIDIILSEGTTEYLGEQLRAGLIDVGLICTINRTMPALFADPFFATEEVFCEELVVIVPTNHVLAEQKTITMQALRDQPFIALQPGSGLRQALTVLSQAAGFIPYIAYESGDIHTICALVTEGLGVAIVPRSVAESQGSGFRLLPFEAPSPYRSVLLVWPNGRVLSPSTKAWLSFFRDTVPLPLNRGCS
jgi:DNA-binding transcriptional LysR family regulator